MVMDIADVRRPHSDDVQPSTKFCGELLFKYSRPQIVIVNTNYSAKKNSTNRQNTPHPFNVAERKTIASGRDCLMLVTGES